jgi:hypothetical protein
MGGGGNSRGMGTSASDRGSNNGNYGYGGGNFGGGYSNSSSSSQLSMAGNFMGGGGGDNMMPQQQQNNMAAVFGMIQQQTNSTSIQNNSCCRLRVLFNPSMSKDMFWSLFNIVPGLEHCELIEMAPEGAWGGVIYNNPRSAAWAIERIHNFEYPTGSKLVVTYDDMAPRSGGAFSTASGNAGMGGHMSANAVGGGGGPMSANAGGGEIKSMPSDIQSLVTSIQAATEALKASGYGNVIGGGVATNTAMGGGGVFGGNFGAGDDAQSVCSAKLPDRQPTLPANTRAEERLFFVLKDARDPPPPAIVTDLFCRFGDLIDAYCLPRKKCGYARYARKESASAALAALHDEDLCGSRLKVVLADEEKGGGKRPRLD